MWVSAMDFTSARAAPAGGWVGMKFAQMASTATTRQRWLQAAWLAAFAIAIVVAMSPSASRATGNFTPTITLETSTTRAAAHPDARITIDNSSSSEDIKDLTIDLPNGFMGSLNAAPQCEVADAQAATCPANSAIGTVTNYARVDNSDVKLKGTVYLTEALPPNDTEDPAGLQIVVPATIGGVTLDPVIVNARVQIRHGELDPGYTTAPAGTLGPVEGVRTIVTDIPEKAVDSANNREVEFSLQKLIVDLRSDQAPPFKKLLTNPSACGPVDISAQATSYDSTGEDFSDTYTVDQCDLVEVGSAEVDFIPDNTNVSTPLQFSTSVTFADDTPAVHSVTIGLPTSAAINTNGFGNSADRCSPDSYDQSLTQNVFNPVDCPTQAKFATAEIETPLLPDPLQAELYFIEASPVPHIGLYVDPTMGPNNPAGVEFGLMGLSSQANVATCAAPCASAVTHFKVQFPTLPDVPLKKITVTTDGVSRTGEENPPGTPVTIDANFLSWVSSTDSQCLPNDDAFAKFESHVDADSQARPFADLDAVSITGCDPRLATLTDSPLGGVASANPPTLTFQTATSPTRCAIDLQSGSVINTTLCSPVAGTSTFTPSSPLASGVHYLFARPGTQFNWRPFIIEAPQVSSDATAPVTQIDSGPTGVTSESTPTWDFSADEDAFFECSIDDGAFVLCDPGASAASSGSFSVADDDQFYAGTQHKFSVRARDEAGNLGTAVEASIDVQIAFAPSLTTTLSTTQARAHPDLDITISSESNEDMKSVGVSLPDGFFGGLTGVQSLCPLATAAAGNCTAASRAGTVETEARVDDSLVRIDGEVFLTESAHAGEPAGLSIKVPAVIQDIDLGDIIVSGRLIVRGQAQGVDSLVVDIPKEIDPADSGNTIDSLTEFDMRKITLKLRTGPGATYPLLTNPSSCNGSAFVAYFNGYASSSTTDADAFVSTGCGSLPFSPRIAMSVVDSTTGQPPVNGSASDPVSANLTAVLSSNPGYAGIKNVGILMPKPLTINVLEIPPACEVAQYANGAGQCPATSIVGSVSAVSPLLPEPLGGSVYLLKQSNPAKATPRLLIALRGRINVDIIADNSFVNGTQILTTLNDLPDVPLSSFTINVDRVLSTRNEACTVPSDEWNAVGNMTDFNGRTAPINQHLVFGCEPQYSFRYRNRGDRSFLNVEAIGGPKQMRKLTVRLPLGVRIVKKNLKRKLVVRADGKRLSSRCYRVARATLTLRLCGRDVSVLRAEFRRGSLTTNRKAVPNKRVKRLSLWGADRDLDLIRFER